MTDNKIITNNNFHKILPSGATNFPYPFSAEIYNFEFLS